MNPIRWILLLMLFTWTRAVDAADPLRDYVQKADSSYAWKTGETSTLSDDVTLTEVDLTSQTWQGITWKHHLSVLKPKSMRRNPTALLFITGDYRPNGAALFAGIAARVRQPIFILWDIPNQPLYDNLEEDALISYTFQRYLQTQDPTWPLLFPMTKGAVRAMDAAQELAKKEWKSNIPGFVVTGASKRGWTTWLTGIADKRVRGIAPMVYDNLNIPAQLPYQVETWGTYSEQIADYTSKGLQKLVDTPEGKRLTVMVDPYTYRKEIGIPKLLIHGTNDRYWTLDAARHYINDLTGRTNFLYVPNSGHGLQDFTRVANTLGAFWKTVSDAKTLPALPTTQSERFERRNGEKGEYRVTAQAGRPAKTMRLWRAESASRDFRDAKWTSVPMEPSNEAHTAMITVPETGFFATFVEAEFEIDGHGYTLSTVPQVRRADGSDPGAAKKGTS